MDSTMRLGPGVQRRIEEVIDSFLRKGRQDNPPKFVVLAGGVGSGKSTVRREKYSEGYVLIDAGELLDAFEENTQEHETAKVGRNDALFCGRVRKRINVAIESSVASGGHKMPQNRPGKKCDLVMKGGVTSGVVYPRAISTLSKEYQFSSIGGTSAGAIAASVAAAAEYARANGKLDAFDKVDELPGWLGETSKGQRHSNLFHLFQPQRELGGLFRVAISGLGKTGARKSLSVFGAALRAFPFAAFIGLAPGLVMAWISSTPTMRWVGFSVAMLIGFLGLILGLVLGAALQARTVPDLAWGLCSGMTEDTSGKPALVPWLAGYLDTLAEKKAGEPLTFGDLRGREINLAMITANLIQLTTYSGKNFRSSEPLK
jgi:hypothetical protein